MSVTLKKLNLLCNASMSVMNLGAFLSAHQSDYWSVIDHDSYDAKKSAPTEVEILTIAQIRELVDGRYGFHVQHYRDDIYDLTFYDPDPVAGEEVPVFNVLMQRIGQSLVYSGETCVQEADPHGFIGHTLTAEEESAIARLVFEVV